MGVNLTHFIKPLKLNSVDSKYKLTLKVLLNGIEVINENRFEMTQEQVNSGTMFSTHVDFLFKGIFDIYKMRIENVT